MVPAPWTLIANGTDVVNEKLMDDETFVEDEQWLLLYYTPSYFTVYNAFYVWAHAIPTITQIIYIALALKYIVG